MAKKIRSLILSLIVGGIVSSCSLSSTSPEQVIQATPVLLQVITIELTVQADTSLPYDSVGQLIKFTYNIKNTGSTSTPGPVSVSGAAVTCPQISTVGNLDNALDVNETLVCTSSYPVTQEDLNKGSVINIATAAVNGINSNPVTTTVPTVQPVVLKITKTADPVTYDHLGQTITYSYVITNVSAAPIGPTQFVVTDAGLAAPIPCGDANLTLASNATASCSATYTITQANMDAASVSTNATAAASGVAPSKAVNALITKSTGAQPNPSAANMTAGSTIKHQVVEGEWLWQIARCYGADPTQVIKANPQLPVPAQISPGMSISVPGIGSAGKIYGPPCVGTHTVQSGDTWSSIALKYNADQAVLQMVNSNTLAVGSVIKVPLNSAGGLIASTPTGSTGNCVDLTRNIKFANTNANKTHFSMCGVLDAVGNMKITTINIKQRPEDVPVGGFSQDFSSLPLETFTPINEPNSLIVGDMNYDGNDDFRILKNVPAGPNLPYLYYLYDPATSKFVYSQAYQIITSPEFTGNSEIRSKWRESATKWGIDTYKITNNVPALTQRESWEILNATQATHRIVDGVGQITVQEVVPIPVQP